MIVFSRKRAGTFRHQQARRSRVDGGVRSLDLDFEFDSVGRAGVLLSNRQARRGRVLRLGGCRLDDDVVACQHLGRDGTLVGRRPCGHGACGLTEDAERDVTLLSVVRRPHRSRRRRRARSRGCRARASLRRSTVPANRAEARKARGSRGLAALSTITATSILHARLLPPRSIKIAAPACSERAVGNLERGASSERDGLAA